MKQLILPVCLLIIASCGSQKAAETQAPGPVTEQPKPLPSDENSEFTSSIKPIVAKNCGGGNCHTSGSARDAVIQTASAFVSGGAGQRLQSNSMPPQGSPQAGTLTAGEKSTLLAFIAKYK